MRTRFLRLRGIIPSVVVGTAAGLLLGYLWGREVTLRSAQERLVRFAERIRASAENSADEARRVLQELNELPDPSCSDAELDAFGRLIYSSEYLKDAGRMADGKIACSALLGRLAHPFGGIGPGFMRPDGTHAYRNLGPYKIQGETVVAVQSGNALVVYSPYNLRPLQSPPMQFIVSDRDLSTGRMRHLIGQVPIPEPGQAVFTTDGIARYHGTLYATRCTARYAGCMTAYISVDDAIQSENAQFRIYIGLSGLCGALWGLVISMVYRRNRSIEQQLRRAIRRNQLNVAYQPIFDLESGRPVAAEALARWTDEGGVVVSPDTFIKAAEDHGFIGEITRVMVDHAAAALQQISAANPEFRINVNIAPADLNDPAFLPMVREALDRTSVPARCLGFEITESSWADSGLAHGAVVRLREQGHLVHIDDFGTGYSSLAYLHNLPVDVLKIDKEFTQSIGTQSVKISIVPQILSMAETLHLRVVVEGVETEEQARYFALARPAVMVQGWYFGLPMTAEDLLALLRNNRRIPAMAVVQPSTFDTNDI